MLPSLTSMIISCLLCGFPMPVFRAAKLQTSINVYCLITTMLQCVILLILLFIRLYSMVYSMNEILFTTLGTMSSVVIIYYKIKFFLNLETSRNIVENITYIDKSIKSLYISFPHARYNLSLIHI